MEIEEALNLYLKQGSYFDPEYERRNEVLMSFKDRNPELSQQQTLGLEEILLKSNEQTEKYFVADLLYLYESFNDGLMNLMLENSIQLGDPSFNRIFLIPCIRAFEHLRIVNWLKVRFETANAKDRIRISSLIYHLNVNRVNTDKLKSSILDYSKGCNNLIELYHFKLALGDLLPNNDLPTNANALTSMIIGNDEYEHLLFEELGWQKR